MVVSPENTIFLSRIFHPLFILPRYSIAVRGKLVFSVTNINKQDEMLKQNLFFSKVLKILAAAGVILMLISGAGLWAFHKYPSIAAYGSDRLRQIVGDQAVAAMETVLYQAQDDINKIEYRLGLLHPSNPLSSQGIIVQQNSIPNTGMPAKPASSPLKQSHAKGAAPVVLASNAAKPFVKSPASSSPTTWDLPKILPNGIQPGEGVWQPYIQTASGQVIAYQTFVQPDPTRPYVTVAVVAFDLHAVRLHYVIGFEEPYSSKQLPKQTGAIPSADMTPNGLVAAFNGGFKYRHGQFGSMSGGFTSAPIQVGLGSVAIYADGTVKIGQWGKDITNSPDLVAVRQNGPLLIQDGQISPLVDTAKYWGYTLSGDTVTWRSGIALSPEGRTLYYFAGPSLSAPTLAATMLAVHPQSAMQLDINNYWVHFVAIQSANNKLDSLPLFPKVMVDGKNRFLQPYARDFFYVTANK
jgi:hypothetical protein